MNGPASRSTLLRAGHRLSLLRKALPPRARLIGGLEHGGMAAAAALLAYLPPHALDLPQSFWASITAVAVVQTKYSATRSTGRDQVTGAAVGGLGGGVMALAFGDNLPAYIGCVLAVVILCWVLNVSSAARLAGTTATIILLVPHDHASVLSVTLARLGEVGWGVTVALAVSWLGARVIERMR